MTSLMDRLKEYARLERMLALVLAFTPLFLIVFSSGDIEPTISDYYDMKHEQVFYLLLIVAAMLFVVNGVINNEHGYNTTLGILLFGVVSFNLDDATLLHNLFAIGFFVGNAVVIAFFSKGAVPYKATLLGTLAVAALLFFFVDWFDLFWLEWASLLVIAAHYYLDTLDGVPYRAAAPGEGPAPGLMR